jgi:hypothetical protein
MQEIASKKSIPQAYVAWRAGTRSREPYSYTWCLAPHRLLKNSNTGYIAWQNWFLGIDSFKNSELEFLKSLLGLGTD